MLIVTYLTNLFWLLGVHALCDYALQDEWMRWHKNPTSYSTPHMGPWWWTMGAHSLINGLGVAVVTRSPALGILESVIHFVADTAKCKRFIGTWADQGIHLACKGVFAWLM